MDIHSIPMDRKYEKCIEKLCYWLEPKKLDRKSTMFDAGYEQAKADLTEILLVSAGQSTVTPLRRLLEQVS